MVVVPVTAQAFTRNLKTSHSWYHDSLPDVNASTDSIVLAWYPPEGLTNITISRKVGNATQECEIFAGISIAICLFPWPLVPSEGLVIRTNFTDAWGTLYVKAGEGTPADVDGFSEPIPLTAGSHLSAILSITERHIFSMTAIDLLGLVNEDKIPPNFGSDTASLRLRPRTDFYSSTNIVQDYTDASILNGIATFGGFWTFTDGTFAILFGANILYFLYGSRPLSPLGFIHFLQRRMLMRRWNEDFPAFRTEGGQPGTENAGIVAFMRERFVDIESEGPKINEVEPQHLSEDVSHPEEMQEKDNGVPCDILGVETDGNVQHCEPGEEGGLNLGFAYLAGVA
ncbi:hypothetical protein B0H14DRAFT_3638401 [Mycena olivaceomarginata]|nr:hypothetical protein B0H14DRAFT_3638401 [Mycena olivaceomarginata]